MASKARQRLSPSAGINPLPPGLKIAANGRLNEPHLTLIALHLGRAPPSTSNQDHSGLVALHLVAAGLVALHLVAAGNRRLSLGHALAIGSRTAPFTYH
jgi:hypothetical protein